jgi:hypothetical protein
MIHTVEKILEDQCSAVVLGLVVVIKGQTTLPVWSYFVALILGGE